MVVLNRFFVTAWALGGFIALLGFALYRLAEHFFESLNYDFSWYHWLLLVANTSFMAYSEGYKGFQKSYSIKFADRIKQLCNEPSPIRVLLAPLFCMNYFQASKKNMILAYILTTLIIALIIIFNYIPQPWRGILDLGVVVGLSWGMVATIIITLKTVFCQQK